MAEFGSRGCWSDWEEEIWWLRKVARFWANHSYSRGKRRHLVSGIWSVCRSTFRSSDWLQSLQHPYVIDVFPPAVISASTYSKSSHPEDGGRTLHRNVEKLIGLQWKNTKIPTVGIYFVVVSADLGSQGTQFKPHPFMSGLLIEVCRYFPQSLYAFTVLNVNVWVVIIATSSQGFPDSGISLETAYHDWGGFFDLCTSDKCWNTAIQTGNHRFLTKSYSFDHLQVCRTYML
jgi:hypothetical protein